jgi:hypothetical protein
MSMWLRHAVPSAAARPPQERSAPQRLGAGWRLWDRMARLSVGALHEIRDSVTPEGVVHVGTEQGRPCRPGAP